MELVSGLNAKVYTSLHQRLSRLEDNITAQHMTQATLKDGAKRIDAAEEALRTTRDRVVAATTELEGKRAALESWVELQERQSASGLDANAVVMPVDRITTQLFDAVAEAAACDDVLYQLGTAVRDGTIAIDPYLREVRRVARTQFYAKALAIKISMAQTSLVQGSARPAGM
jgi:ESCRT-I complex subunit TSG101